MSESPAPCRPGRPWRNGAWPDLSRLITAATAAMPRQPSFRSPASRALAFYEPASRSEGRRVARSLQPDNDARLNDVDGFPLTCRHARRRPPQSLQPLSGRMCEADAASSHPRHRRTGVGRDRYERLRSTLNGVLGQCGCRGPKTVDRLLGRRKALGGQRDQLGHGRVYLGECELGRDEARLQARRRQAVR
jgi:hypothetical protein